jgi:hypothetical protein
VKRIGYNDFTVSADTDSDSSYIDMDSDSSDMDSDSSYIDMDSDSSGIVMDLDIPDMDINQIFDGYSNTQQILDEYKFNFRILNKNIIYYFLRESFIKKLLIIIILII